MILNFERFNKLHLRLHIIKDEIFCQCDKPKTKCLYGVNRFKRYLESFFNKLYELSIHLHVSWLWTGGP